MQLWVTQILFTVNGVLYMWVKSYTGNFNMRNKIRLLIIFPSTFAGIFGSELIWDQTCLKAHLLSEWGGLNAGCKANSHLIVMCLKRTQAHIGEKEDFVGSDMQTLWVVSMSANKHTSVWSSRDRHQHYNPPIAGTSETYTWLMRIFLNLSNKFKPRYPSPPQI